MSRLACWFVLPALLAWFAPSAEAAQADRIHIPEVNDQAKLFSNEAKKKANDTLDAIQRRFKLELVIDTFEHGPQESPASWARSKAKEKGVNGIYVVLTKDTHHFEVVVSDSASKKGLLKGEDAGNLVKLLREKLKGAGEDQARRDEALLAATSFVLHTFEEHQPTAPAVTPAPAKKAPVNERDHPHQPAQDIPWGKYLLIGLGALLVFWLVIGIIRAFSGSAGSGMAPGGYGGGGGGGFFSSLLGGMFGAAAGMWLYSSFFGHQTPSAFGGDPGAAGPSPGSAESNDPGGYTSAGGGDYGDAGAMPDADQGQGGGDDAGGGDWGDAGGGGDFGGGGGDFGGGGDW